MSYLPVESMKIGGLLWFPDLTAADPTFVLPVVCAATMLLTIEVSFFLPVCMCLYWVWYRKMKNG